MGQIAAKEYVEQRDGGYYLAGSRVSLDPVVYAFLRGESPEAIADSFPAVTIEQVFGAIAYFLEKRDAIEAYLRDGRTEFARVREDSRRRHPALYAKLEAARRAASDPAA